MGGAGVRSRGGGRHLAFDVNVADGVVNTAGALDSGCGELTPGGRYEIL